MLVALLAASCGSSEPGSKCLQLANDFCQCWVHYDFPPDPTDVPIAGCGFEDVPGPSGSGIFAMVPICCASAGYPSSGTCFCTTHDTSETGAQYCPEILLEPGAEVARCATGGKLMTTSP